MVDVLNTAGQWLVRSARRERLDEGEGCSNSWTVNPGSGQHDTTRYTTLQRDTLRRIEEI